jgi:glycosyltransferase involved in cell wall biosynthesis
MAAGDILRRMGNRLRATVALRKGSPVSRVVVVSNTGSFGGGGAVGFREIALAIREKRPDVDVVGVYPWKGNLAADCAQHGVRAKVAWIPWWGFLERWRRAQLEALIGWLPRAVLLLPGIVQAVWLLVRLRPTFVLTNTMVIPSHAIAAKLLGIPHYWMVREFGRDDHGLRFLLGYRGTVRVISRLSESVICNSRAVEQAMLALVPEMKTHVVYPVVDTPIGAATKREPGEPMRVVLVGKFSQSKGQHIAIEAVAHARKAGVDIELALVGAGNDKVLHTLVGDLDVEDLVTFHEPTRDLGRHWSAAHVGLMCSECEAFGRVTVEAMRG